MFLINYFIIHHQNYFMVIWLRCPSIPTFYGNVRKCGWVFIEAKVAESLRFIVWRMSSESAGENILKRSFFHVFLFLLSLLCIPTPKSTSSLLINIFLNRLKRESTILLSMAFANLFLKEYFLKLSFQRSFSIAAVALHLSFVGVFLFCFFFCGFLVRLQFNIQGDCYLTLVVLIHVGD